MMGKVYCEVCGMATESNIGISWGNKTVFLCGGHELKDLRAMTQPSIDPQLDKLLDTKFDVGVPGVVGSIPTELKAAINAHYISRKRVLEALKIDHPDVNVPSDRLNAQEDGEVIGWYAAIDAIKKELNL